ncbi:MAG: transporter substrate-binding domain-containing protein [Clostridiales bacterium]|nr:transporter substrate-binding domain-containing protein [Clostridiales bacterium]
MKTIKKTLAVVLCALMVVTCFAGCSSSEGTDTETAKVKVIDVELTSEEYAFGVDKDQADLLESVNEFIAEIQSNGKFDEICNNYFGDGTPVAVTSAEEDSSKDQLLVATNAAFEPFEYTQGDSYYGIDMEIASLLAESLGKELVIKNMDFDSVCLSVGQHKADIAMAGLTVKAEREEYVTFSTSYYSASQKLIVPADNTEFDDCQTADDVVAILNTKTSDDKIGVQNGTTGQFYVEGDADWEFDGLPATCVGYKNGSLAVQDLVNGNLTYVIIDSAPADCITEAINAVA